MTSFEDDEPFNNGVDGGGSDMDQGDYDEPDSSFSCRSGMLNDITTVLTSLLSANPKDALPCLIEAKGDSFTFVVTGRSKCTQARASLSMELFDNYVVDGIAAENGESIRISLHLPKLIDCLQLFGGSDSTTVNMSYSTADNLFRVTLEDSGIITTCDITTLDLEGLELEDGSLFSVFVEHEEVWSLLMKSEPLKGSFQELFDISGANSVLVELKNEGLNLSTVGIGESTCQIEIPRSSAAFVSFSRSPSAPGGNTPTVWTYPISSIQLGMKAINFAKETYIRINSEGMMCIQHQLTTKDERGDNFIDICTAAETEDDTAYEEAEESKEGA
jgi:hypothetical protein